ncbi:MAG: hypothetical protein R3305_11925 [Gammaproteobacteria bacterium]|nr:hypothetical protein [Gammaproteobacteria bacterium]
MFQSKSLPTIPIKRLAVTAVAMLFAVPASAQEATPNWLEVVIVEVVPGHAADFEDRIKELTQALYDSGQPGMQVFSVEAGNPGEYHFVTPRVALAALDDEAPPMEPALMAAWTARTMTHIGSMKWFFAELYPEHAMQTDAAESSEMIVLQKVRTVAGKEAEYEAWVADHYMPALRESDALSHTLSHGVFGDSLQHYYHAAAVANWARFDQPHPLALSMGERAFNQLMDRLDGIVEDRSLIVARIRPDLMGGN